MKILDRLKGKKDASIPPEKEDFYWDGFSGLEKSACFIGIAEVLKSHIYMMAEEKARQALVQLEGMKLGMHSKIAIRFEVDFLMNDLLAIVGLVRRMADGELIHGREIIQEFAKGIKEAKSEGREHEEQTG
jgi:hypothetical protein